MQYPVYYYAANGELCPVEGAVVADDQHGFRFESGIRDMVWMAGMNGDLLYFAQKRVFGVYCKLLDHPGKMSFWWLFENCREPEFGRAAVRAWFGKEVSIATLTAAEFCAAHMQLRIEQLEKINSGYMSQPIDYLLPKLVGLFRTEMLPHKYSIAGLFPNTAVIPPRDGEPEREAFISFEVTFMDKSEMMIDHRGYSASLTMECEIFARNAEGIVDPVTVVLSEFNVEATRLQ